MIWCLINYCIKKNEMMYKKRGEGLIGFLVGLWCLYYLCACTCIRIKEISSRLFKRIAIYLSSSSLMI